MSNRRVFVEVFFVIAGLAAVVICLLCLSMHGWHGSSGPSNVVDSLVACFGVTIGYLQLFVTFPVFHIRVINVPHPPDGRGYPWWKIGNSPAGPWRIKIDHPRGGSSLMRYGIAVMIGGPLLVIYAVIQLNLPRTLAPIIAAIVLFLIAGVILPFGLLGLHAIQGSVAGSTFRRASTAGTVVGIGSWLINDATALIWLFAIGRTPPPAILTLQHVNMFFVAVGNILIAAVILRAKVFPQSTAVVLICIAFVTFLYYLFPASAAPILLNLFGGVALGMVYCAWGYTIFHVMRRPKAAAPVRGWMPAAPWWASPAGPAGSGVPASSAAAEGGAQPTVPAHGPQADQPMAHDTWWQPPPGPAHPAAPPTQPGYPSPASSSPAPPTAAQQKAGPKAWWKPPPTVSMQPTVAQQKARPKAWWKQ